MARNLDFDRRSRRRLAAVAAYNGVHGEYWDRWLSSVGAKGAEKAIAELSEDEAYWFASWCFVHRKPKLGLLAFERHLAVLGAGKSANKFVTWEYFGWALREGEAMRAWKAFGPVREARGCKASDEVLFAAAAFVAKKIDRATALKVVSRHAMGGEALVHAARAVALDALGAKADACAIIAQLDRETAFAPAIRWLLHDRFGAAFDEATGRARAAPVKVKPMPGFVVVPSSRKTPHEFAPEISHGPPCRGCGHPLRVWFSLDISGLKLARWKRFNAPACFDCNFWMLRHDFISKKGNRFEIEAVEPSGKELGKPFDDHSSEPIARRYAKWKKAPRDLDERPLDGECQVGGRPAWIQDAVDVHCRSCERAMVFVLRLSSPNDFDGCPEIAGGSGALYYFACPACARFSVVAQWT